MDSHILFNLVYFLGCISAIVCIIVAFKGYTQNRKLVKKAMETDQQINRMLEHYFRDSEKAFFKLQDEVKSLTSVDLNNMMDKIVNHLHEIQTNVKDLNLRVSIAEVRLEERRPQTIIPVASAPAKRGRKPKQLS
jgi:hypothetical protein